MLFRKQQPQLNPVSVIEAEFDRAYYIAQYPDVASAGIDPVLHYLQSGWREGRNPNKDFSTRFYLASNPDVASSGINPFQHYLQSGRAEGRKPKAVTAQPEDIAKIEAFFDKQWYLSCFESGAAPEDPIVHYLECGWLEGRDPSPEFSTRHYLAQNPDIQVAGINPLVHFALTGHKEVRSFGPNIVTAGALASAQAFATSSGPYFEHFDESLGVGRSPLAKIIAYYLPQFHAIPENDAFWGDGFTEWRNVSRGLPRYSGHVQPRLPRDLGFYNLKDTDIYRRQISLARQAGVHAFCYYYYWFNRKRVLEGPIDRMLADPTLDFPFVLMWANENWTRAWDGSESEILLRQDYADSDDDALVDDFARHMKDSRYMRIGEKPILFIYRPGHIPNLPKKLKKWRASFSRRHGLEPLFFMAQGFESFDPRPLGLDGAIEFPPHKLGQYLPNITPQSKVFDKSFKGFIHHYDDVMIRAEQEPDPDFHLIRCAFPGWDNESRRPNRGTSYAGATPQKFETWMRRSINFARRFPIKGDAIVAVNAWNEWAEAAYLEPDVHNGYAYLNALSRAAYGVLPASKGRRKVIILGHDGHRHGAQILALNLGRALSTVMGLDVAYIIGDDGVLVANYREVGQTYVVKRDRNALRSALNALKNEGYGYCITNTTVVGWATEELFAAGISTISLVHELRQVVEEFGLTSDAKALAKYSGRMVFPAEIVRESFLEISGPPTNSTEILPQGLYKLDMLTKATPRLDARNLLNLPEKAKVIINVGYGDVRKGTDRFFSVAIEMCAKDPLLHFIWVGNIAQNLHSWLLADIARSGFSDRIQITGLIDDVEPYYAAADVFFLTAREDPFPSVVLEAFSAGLPVVGFSGTGGCDQIIESHGVLIRTGKNSDAIGAIQRYFKQSVSSMKSQANLRKDLIKSEYQFDMYCHALLKRLYSELQSVTVLVPNYNYERYLADRLDTVFGQTYPVLEVIVMDDASTDQSVDVIESIRTSRRRDIKLVVNETNSGSAFAQWRKGLSQSRGEYVWIAEADDVADPELLQKLITQMERTNADLGFCDSWQMDTDGNRIGDSYRPYLNEIEPGAFDQSFDMDGIEFLRRFLAVKNVILNVSGVVFRRKALQAALDTVGAELDTFRVAGDWRLYAEICKAGGRVVYEIGALNGHRRHATSITHSLKAAKHLGEIEQMHVWAQKGLALSPITKEKQEAHREASKAHLDAFH